MRKHRKEIGEDFLAIDLGNLHLEWVNQPLLAKQFSDLLAEAREDLEMLKSKMDLKKSDVDYDVRRNPQDYGIEKITEPAIKMAIASHAEIVALEKKILKAKRNVDDLSGACNAIEHRKRALENLVSLWMASYFAEPRAPGPAAKERLDEAAKEEVRRRRKK